MHYKFDYIKMKCLLNEKKIEVLILEGTRIKFKFLLRKGSAIFSILQKKEN
jgi:hypothetical protein